MYFLENLLIKTSVF